MNPNFGQDLFPSHQFAALKLHGEATRRPFADPGAYPMTSGYLVPSDFYGMPFPAPMPLMPPPLQYQHHFVSGEPYNFISAGTAQTTFNFTASETAPLPPLDRHRTIPMKSPEDYGLPPLAGQSKQVYSRKVFVGGLPIDITEDEVSRVFGVFGNVVVDWPRRNDREDVSTRSMTGYVFLVFESESSVSRLIADCHHDDSRYYLFVTSRTMKDKPVQVRPWLLSDTDYTLDECLSVDGRRTVFIGGVPRPTKAKDLADALCRLYGPVSYVGIDIDPELKYPKGAARVTFATPKGYIAAITGRFVYVSHAESEKRVEIKPYLMDDQMCDECQGKNCSFRYASYFCGDPHCLQYFCESCWDHVHCSMSSDKFHHHCPMIRQGDQTKVLQRPPHHRDSRNNGGQRGYQRTYSIRI